MKKIKPVVLITGGAQGIGMCMAEVFLRRGYRAAIADPDKEAGEELKTSLKAGRDFLYVPADVSEEKDCAKFVRAAAKQFGRIDLLINNAGIGINKRVTELTLNEWNRVIGTNLTGAFLCSKYAVPFLAKVKGSIINMASTRSIMSEKDTEAYSASKGGILALTHAMAVSLGPDIRVNCISPGWIEVSNWRKKSARKTPIHTAADINQHPAGRVGNPYDIAELAIFLASDKAGFITGQNYVVDGGMTKKMIYV